MPYDVPLRTDPDYTNIPLNAAFTKNVRGPRGKRGIVRRIYGTVNVTTSWTGAAPVITVTTTASPVPNRKGGIVYPASTTVFTATLVPTTAPAGFDTETRQSIAGGPGNNLVDENGLAFMTAADSDLVIALSAAGGTVTGNIDFTVEIAWV